jgi:hypothetical protein
MKPLHVIHLVITLLLILAVGAFGALLLTGVLEVRLPKKTQASDHPAREENARPAAEPTSVKARLLVVRGAKPDTEYDIYEGRNILGRADQKPVDIDLQFQESPERIWSSRQHAVITCENGSLVIEDLNSSNGTYVNRNRVLPGQKQALKADDIIQIGEVQFKVVPRY